MTTVIGSRTYPTSASDLWQLMGDFYGIDTWMVGVESVSRLGANIRQVKLHGGAGALIEELLEERTGFQRYRFIDSGPVPVADYVAEISVTDGAAGESRMEWTATFEPVGVPQDVARAAVEGNVSASMERIAEIVAIGA